MPPTGPRRTGRVRRTGTSGQPTAISSAALPRQKCEALFSDGKKCHALTPQPNRHFCWRHHLEYQALYAGYKSVRESYEVITKPFEEFTLEELENKISVGKKAVEFRDVIHLRFFSSPQADNRRNMRWILKLRSDVKIFEERRKSLLQRIDSQSKSASIPIPTALVTAQKPENPIAYRSYLDPALPMEALSHLPSNHPVLTIREAMASICQGFIEKLYEIAPSLNDSNDAILGLKEPTGGLQPDAGDHVVRFVFREFIVWKADTETLACATEGKGINKFLKTRSVTQLQEYVKFFESFGEGKPDTWHFLRDAVCDYLLAAHSNIPSLSILGCSIATDDNPRAISRQGWDILYQYFGDIVSWYNVDGFCSKFEELLVIKRLIAVGWYGEDKSDKNGWLCPNLDVSQECQVDVLLGFCADTKGYYESPEPDMKNVENIITETQSRYYAAGKMALNNPLAKALITELGNRVARFITIVYEGPTSQYVGKIVFESEKNPWIKRKRSAKIGQRLDCAEWQIEWPFENILGDLERIRSFRKDNAMTDYFQFIIIDRHPRTHFNILEEVAGALIKLSKNPPLKHIVSDVIGQLFPEHDRKKWLEAASFPVTVYSGPSEIKYEAARVREWDVNPEILLQHAGQSQLIPNRRFTSAVLADMEANGIITLQNGYERPQAYPVIITGTDGNEDLYFYYHRGPLAENIDIDSTVLGKQSDPSPGCLSKFALSYASQHPNAIFAKGKIHTHYCSWPMEPLKRHGVPTTFETFDGHIYRWNFLPFDFPFASRIWQYLLKCRMNDRFPFVYFAHTTFVICGKSVENAEENLRIVLEEADKYGWRLSVSGPALWSSELKTLDLNTLWKGISPARY